MRRKQTRQSLTFMAVAFIIGCLALPMIPFGYAEAYSAVTVNTGNTINASYFTVSLYKYEGENPQDVVPDFSDNMTGFSPADTFVESEGVFTYSSATKKISAAEYTISPANIYIVISQNGSFDSMSYSLGNHQITIKDGETAISTITKSTMIAGNPSNASATSVVQSGQPAVSTGSMSANTAYKLTIKVDLNETSVTNTTLTCEMNLTSILVNVNGIYVITGCDIGLSNGTVVEEIIADNTGFVSTEPESYGPNTYYVHTSPTTPVDYPSTFPGSEGVRIQGNDGGGVAKGGTIDVTITIPDNKDYIVCLVGLGGKATGTLKIYNVIGDKRTQLYSYTISVNGVHSNFFYLGSNNQLARTESISNVGNWLPPVAEGSIQIEIDGTNQSNAVGLDLVFKPHTS